MKYKSTLALFALGLVISIMITMTVIVSITVGRQNQGVSMNALKNAFTIVQFQLTDLKKS